MRIRLLGTDPGDRQWSILNYGTYLHEGLEKLTKEADFTLAAPDSSEYAHLRKSRLGRAGMMYWSRYMAYPKLLRQGSFELNHILDQGNSCHIKHLNPETTLVTCHDLIPLLFPDKMVSLLPAFSRRSYRHAISGLTKARAILTVSQNTKQDLQKHLAIPAERIHITRLGIDPLLEPASPDGKTNARKALMLPEEPLLLHVGQTVFYKNLEGLLHILHELKKRKVRFQLVRGGPLLPSALKKLAQDLNVWDCITEMGVLSTQALRQLYHACDVFVFPSLYEGFGIPPLEAMASGLPVVSSNAGSLEETISDAGIAKSPDDIAGFADAIETLLQSESTVQDYIQRGYTHVQKFQWPETAKQTWSVYQKVLGHV